MDYIYDKMSMDLDYVIPFAAISEGGREIDGVDDRSELGMQCENNILGYYT